MSDLQISAIAGLTDVTASVAQVRRASYSAPQLQRFGALSSLTTAGAGSQTETDTVAGQPNMGSCMSNNMNETDMTRFFCS